MKSDVAKYVFDEVMEGVCFLLWLSRGSLKEVIFGRFVPNSFNKRYVQRKIKQFHRNGYISQLKSPHGLQLIFNSLKWDRWGHLWSGKSECYQRGWDGYWRVVVYDIPEKQRWKRDCLRDFLKNLGFGKINDSVWVSPYDFADHIVKFGEKHSIMKYICAHKGEFFAGRPIEELVEDAWQLQSLSDEYDAFVEKCTLMEQQLSVSLHGVLSSGQYFELYREFKQLNLKDPFLPDRFLKKWPRNDAENRIKQISQKIMDAQSIFA